MVCGCRAIVCLSRPSSRPVKLPPLRLAQHRWYQRGGFPGVQRSFPDDGLGHRCRGQPIQIVSVTYGGADSSWPTTSRGAGSAPEPTLPASQSTYMADGDGVGVAVGTDGVPEVPGVGVRDGSEPSPGFPGVPPIGSAAGGADTRSRRGPAMSLRRATMR